MSDAAAAARAVDAIDNDLAVRMGAALRALEEYDRRGVRYAAYQAAGINLADYASDELHNADIQALTTEILRRLTQ